MSLMIDAGEGTYGQMIRYFGEVEAQKMVRISAHCSISVCPRPKLQDNI